MKANNLPKVATKNDFPWLRVEPGSLDPESDTLPTEPWRLVDDPALSKYFDMMRHGNKQRDNLFELRKFWFNLCCPQNFCFDGHFVQNSLLCSSQKLHGTSLSRHWRYPPSEFLHEDFRGTCRMTRVIEWRHPRVDDVIVTSFMSVARFEF